MWVVGGVGGWREFEKGMRVWSAMVWPSRTYSPWVCAPWKWKRPFWSFAKPGVEVTICSMAREGTGAGALAMYDLSMSMWLVELSVSNCAAVGWEAVTVTDSDTAETFRLTVSWTGTGEWMSTGMCSAWNPCTSTWI